MIQLCDYLCGGYFLTRPVKRADCFASFLPESIISLSNDICDFVPDAWTLEWARSNPDSWLEDAAKFALEPKAIEDLTQWALKHYDDFGAWHVIFELKTAQELKKKYLSHLNNVVLLGAGLHKTLCDGFLEKTQPPPTVPGFAPNGETGDHAAIKKRKLLYTGGTPLGFEPLAHGIVAFEHSWLCNGLEKYAKEMKIQINENGLIDKYEDALKFTTLLNDGKLGAEPDLWLPWLLVDYSKV